MVVFKLIITILLLAVLAIVAALNWGIVTFNLWFWSFNIPMALLIVIGLVIGVIVTLIFSAGSIFVNKRLVKKIRKEQQSNHSTLEEEYVEKMNDLQLRYSEIIAEKEDTIKRLLLLDNSDDEDLTE